VGICICAIKIHEFKKPPAPLSFSFLLRLASRKGDFGVGELVPRMALFSLHHTINKQRGCDPYTQCAFSFNSKKGRYGMRVLPTDHFSVFFVQL
jgi:hypothetical protein